MDLVQLSLVCIWLNVLLENILDILDNFFTESGESHPTRSFAPYTTRATIWHTKRHCRLFVKKKYLLIEQEADMKTKKIINW